MADRNELSLRGQINTKVYQMASPSSLSDYLDVILVYYFDGSAQHYANSLFFRNWFFDIFGNFIKISIIPQNILMIFQVFPKICKFKENMLTQTDQFLSAILVQVELVLVFH